MVTTPLKFSNTRIISLNYTVVFGCSYLYAYQFKHCSH